MSDAPHTPPFPGAQGPSEGAPPPPGWVPVPPDPYGSGTPGGWGPAPWGGAPSGLPDPAAGPVAGSAPRRRHRVLAVALGVGAVAGVAVGAAAIADAAAGPGSGSPSAATVDAGSPASSSTTTTTPATGAAPGLAPKRAFGAFGPDGLGLGRLGRGLDGALYGQLTIQGPNGYETVAVRRGTVSNVTDTSGSTWTLSVKSADGTTGTFTVNSGTSVNGGEMGIGSVKNGDTVVVVGTVSGSSTTAKEVVDTTSLKANAGSWLRPRPAPGVSGNTGTGNTGTSTSGVEFGAPPV